MAPTTEEELKLRLFNGDMSHLGPAERFLKVLVDIPFAFKRLESLLFMSAVQEEVSSVKESFETLEVKQSPSYLMFHPQECPISLSSNCHCPRCGKQTV